MPLSEHEQKLLEEMERQLFADDPRLARTFHRSTRPRRDRRRITLGILAILVGLVLLVLAVALPMIWLGVAAFVLMVAGGVWAATAPRVADGRAAAGTRPGRAGSSPAASGSASSRSFMRRMEERWDRRGDDDPRL